MKLHNNQFRLLWHLARFNVLDYQNCLDMLATPELTDPVALSYAFRPLAKNKYLIKHKDGSVAILAKGRALFPGIAPLITTGGREQERKRVIQVSRMAALMEAQGFPALDELLTAPVSILSLPRAGERSHPVFYRPRVLLGCW